jgi:hypothetical protein
MSDELENKIQIICRQTDYDYETAKEKLILFDNDISKVVRDYLGVSIKPQTIIPAQSLNQEIYRQFRWKLDANARDYEERVIKQKQVDETKQNRQVR